MGDTTTDTAADTHTHKHTNTHTEGHSNSLANAFGARLINKIAPVYLLLYGSVAVHLKMATIVWS